MNNSRPQLFGMLAGLFLAAGFVLSSMLTTTTWLKVKNSQFIMVKGSTQKDVSFDLVIWHGSFAASAPTLLEAQRQLKDARTRVGQFLNDHGVTNFTFAAIGIEEMSASMKDANGWTQQHTAGYRLTQTVRVESGNLARITGLDGESTALVESGVLFTTLPPQYIYTKLGAEKAGLLADATKDARVRAEQIAVQGGRRIISLHDAEMGVFQITPLHSSQTSWDGENDTTSREKTITAVVTATFLLK
jgi:hypothetical protein